MRIARYFRTINSNLAKYLYNIVNLNIFNRCKNISKIIDKILELLELY